jgi:hypothetical protein
VGQEKGGSVELSMDWDEGEVGADVLTALTNLYGKGLVSKETVAYNVGRAKLLPPGVTPEDELNRLEMEGPPPPAVVPFTAPPKIGPDGKPQPPDGMMQQGA